MDEILLDLEKEYCPPLDTALFRAVANDYVEQSQIYELRVVLDELRSGALAEEQTGFDPSGSGSQPNIDDVADTPTLEPSRSSDSTNWNESGSSNGSLSSQSTYDTGIDNLFPEEKRDLLSQIFPALSPVEIKHALSKCKDNFGATVDELLTRNLLHSGEDSEGEAYVIPKGIDGFATPNNSNRTRKGKNRRNKKHSVNDGSIDSTGSPSTTTVPNKWANVERDVDFIVKRTNLSSSTVKSFYHKAGTSLRGTIEIICQSECMTSSGVSQDNPDVLHEAQQLSQDFRELTWARVIDIVRLTHPSTVAARELINAYLESPYSNAGEPPAEAPIKPQYKLPILEDDHLPDSAWTLAFRNKARWVDKSSDYDNSASMVSKHTAARSAAMAKASSLYRKSRSNPLMAGAAGYYSSEARDHKASADLFLAQAADALAARQSSSSRIDLHGIDVLNAVRITRERVQIWWESRAEWARKGRIPVEDRYEIVTGVGKHSQGGVGKLGPAIRKALREDGWRFEEGHPGEIFVSGRMRGG